MKIWLDANKQEAIGTHKTTTTIPCRIPPRTSYKKLRMDV